MKPHFRLDTSILSEPLKPAPEPRVLDKLKARSARLCTCTVVWHELSFGAHRLTASRRKNASRQYLASVRAERAPDSFL